MRCVALPTLCLYPRTSGESTSAKRARRELTLPQDTIWTGPRASRLFKDGSDRWIAHARYKGAWKRSLRWVREFQQFAKAMCLDSARKFNFKECLANEQLFYLFLVDVANAEKGSTRPVSARRALNRQRRLTHLSSLNDNPHISALIEGVRNAAPKLRKQMESLDICDVDAVVFTWGDSHCWWQRMVALMIGVGFLTLMRCGELVRLLREGVVLVLKSGGEVNPRTSAVLPSADLCSGMLLLVSWRKSKQAANAWLPVSCPRTVELMIKHELVLREMLCTSRYCFPARRKTGRASFDAPKQRNHMGTSSFVRLMKDAMREVCQVEDAELKLYGGHSLRVGGSNFMRWLKVDEDVHKALGGWAHLVSAKEYMQRSPEEQFQLTRSLAVQRKRRVAIEHKGQAVSLLEQFQGLRL